jgi:hypothetical protein
LQISIYLLNFDLIKNLNNTIMSTKVIVGGVISAIVMFLLGWLIYGVILTDIFPMDGEMTGQGMLWIFLSNLFWGLLLAYVLGTWAGVSTPMGGAKAAAIIGLLAGLSADAMGMAMNNMDMKQMAFDVIATVVIAAVAGALIGWYNGRNTAAA